LRDQILSKTAAGSQYIALYYKHAPEITRIFETRPELEGRVRKLIVGLLPAIGDLIAGRKATIQDGTVQEGLMVIDNLLPHASPTLSEDLIRLKRDIHNGTLFYTFKVKIQQQKACLRILRGRVIIGPALLLYIVVSYYGQNARLAAISHRISE